MWYKLIASALAAVILATAVPSFALNRPTLQAGVEVAVVSDNGAEFQKIAWQDMANGQTRIIKRYLEAKKGEKYSIRVRNNSPERVGLVIAVDGRNIISGKRSELASTERMYVVNPYETGQYEGWRTTSSEVHHFYFTEPADSYSVRTFGDSSAMGVIAVAVYREKAKPQPLFEEKQSNMAPSAPSAAGARSAAKALDESAGTGFGESRYSPTITVEFEPERLPAQKTLVKYEWRETLCRRGLLSCGQETGNRLWDDGYAPYPPDCR